MTGLRIMRPAVYTSNEPCWIVLTVINERSTGDEPLRPSELADDGRGQNLASGHWSNVRHLVDSGVTFGLMTDHPVVPSRQLLMQTRWFTRAGLCGDPTSSGIATIYSNQWVKSQYLLH